MSGTHALSVNISRHHPAAKKRYERGVAAVELAIILPFLVLLMALALLFGRTFWYYNVMQKAAHDSARYMSTVAVNDIRNLTRVSHATAVAYNIADQEMSDFNREATPWSVIVLCDGVGCDGFSAPETVRVVIRMPMVNDILGDLTVGFFGDGLLMTADVTMPYLGN